jgi:hypothetical protein
MGDIRNEILQRAAAGDLPGQEYPGQFALDSPRAVIKQASGSGSKPRRSEAPSAKIEEYRLIADTDPHVGEAIDTLVDFLVGSGYSIAPANIVGTDEEQTPQDIADLKALVETSDFEEVLFEWVWHALVDGTGFLEIVVEEDVFKPKVLPTEKMEIQTDQYGNEIEYVLSPDSGDDISFEPFDIAVLRFHKHPGEDFGRSLIERCEEQADMLRDMEIDMARFIATKAYPPVIWKLGTEDRPWTQEQIDGWLDTVNEIEPESMLAVGHDVEHDIVGVTSTSSTSGAMRLEPVFHHLLRRIYTALGLPSFLGNVTGDESKNEAVAVMPKFDRRIQRWRRIINSSIRHQVFVSILAGDSDPETVDVLPPEFEFGQHSSEEERLDADMAIKLVNNGLLTFEAAAERIGIDPETELPQDGELNEHIRKIQELAGVGDSIQNPNGGSPTDTGGGADSAGGEVKTRQTPERDSSGSDSRNKQSITED